MPLVDKVTYIHEPTDLQCGQAVLAMLTGLSVGEIIAICGTDRETNLKQMFSTLDALNVMHHAERKSAESKTDLPKVCILSLETPRCWHWSLYFDGTFYDPEHGVMNKFPECNRKYYWEIMR
ncbi:MAG: hypothetical protein J6Q76_01485 [Clostridia bacterium]|nr:hypothetical protein [Clostridia bacterium]